MKRILTVLLVLTIAWVPERILAKDDFVNQAATMLESVYTDQTPGAVVVISRDGEVLMNRAFGMASLELDVAMSKDHVLRLASLTKQYTAAAILALAEDRKLSLDDPLSTFLPEFPIGEVTVHQLLNHTSGIKSPRAATSATR